MNLTIPIVNKLSLNEIYSGIHYRQRSAHKSEYREYVCFFARNQYTGEYPVHITYRFRQRKRRFDSTNLAYLVKLLEDAIVHAGVIPDDSPKYVAATTMITDRGDDDVVITIDPYCG